VLRNPLYLVNPNGKQIFYLDSKVLGTESINGTYGEYKSVNESNESSANRHMLATPKESGAITNDVGLLDPVDIMAGAISTFGIKLAAKMTMNGGELLLESALKNAGPSFVTESEETGFRFTSNKVREAFEKTIEFLGENYSMKPTKWGGDLGDKVFFSSSSKIRFDLNYFKPHQKPHIDIEKLIEGKWKNVWKVNF
jgi:hypothetical protein